MESMKPLLLLVFYFMDKVKRFRLTREAKVKADKNRSKVKEAFWKSMHAAKAEKAQVKTSELVSFCSYITKKLC